MLPDLVAVMSCVINLRSPRWCTPRCSGCCSRRPTGWPPRGLAAPTRFCGVPARHAGARSSRRGRWTRGRHGACGSGRCPQLVGAPRHHSRAAALRVPMRVPMRVCVCVFVCVCVCARVCVCVCVCYSSLQGEFDFQASLGKFDKAAEMAKLSGDAPAGAVADASAEVDSESKAGAAPVKKVCVLLCCAAAVRLSLLLYSTLTTTPRLCQAYDKSTSFFDTISSDSASRAGGRMNRDQERKYVGDAGATCLPLCVLAAPPWADLRAFVLPQPQCPDVRGGRVVRYTPPQAWQQPSASRWWRLRRWWWRWRLQKQRGLRKQRRRWLPRWWRWRWRWLAWQPGWRLLSLVAPDPIFDISVDVDI